MTLVLNLITTSGNTITYQLFMKMIKKLLNGGVIALSIFFVACNDDDGANLPPEVQDLTLTVAEDVAIGTLVGTIAATDPDGDEISFEITAGNEANAFGLSAEGVLSTLSALDFETTSSYALTVMVSDGMNDVEVMVSIEVTDVDEGDGNAGVDVTIDGVTYTIVDGLIDDFGDDGTHYNYDFILVDDAIDIVNDDLEPGPETTIGIYVELFSAGTGSFTPGTFEYLEESTTPESDQSFFNIFTISTFDEPIGDSESDPDNYYIATGGTVTVTENSDLNYTLIYNVEVAEADLDTDEVISGGSQFTLSFTYSGDFDFIPLEAAARSEGVTSQKKAVF